VIISNSHYGVVESLTFSTFKIYAKRTKINLTQKILRAYHAAVLVLFNKNSSNKLIVIMDSQTLVN